MTSTHERGRLILIEGLDRAGKSSQCQLLADRLDATVIRFPDRTTPIGTLINQYLTTTTSSTTKANTKLQKMHLLFSANRWELVPEIQELLSKGTNVILDRYVYSGIAYSYVASRSPSTSSSTQEPLDLEWLASPDIGLIKPDLIFFLKVSEQVTVSRGGFGEERYEKKEFQKQVALCFDKILPFDQDTCVLVDADMGLKEVADFIYAKVKACPPVSEIAYYKSII